MSFLASTAIRCIRNGTKTYGVGDDSAELGPSLIIKSQGAGTGNTSCRKSKNADEAGAAVVFLMTNGFMNGATINVDGGARLV